MSLKTMKHRPSFDEENKLWQKGYTYVVGIDEVGRGAFAGPLVAAGVILPSDFMSQTSPEAKFFLKHINDSKLLTPVLRAELADVIPGLALHKVIVEIPTSYINSYGIGRANLLAFRRIVRSMTLALPSGKDRLFALIDGFHVKFLQGLGKARQTAVIKGDATCISIAAASVIAKVYRDRYMSSLPEEYRRYNFADHKGYGTLEHRRLIKQYGLCKIHRMSFNLQKFTV